MPENGWRAVLHFLREARRRRVYTAFVAYGAVSVVLIQIAHLVLVDALLLPDWSPRLLTVLLILGFPVVLVLAWIFDIGPGGVRRTDSPERASTDSADASFAGGRPAAAPTRFGNPPAETRFVDRSAARSLSGTPAAAAGVAHQKKTPAAEGSAATPSRAMAPAEPPDPDRVSRAALAHVRHELRTPINAIVGYAELLLEDAAEAESDVVADLRRIQEGGKELLSLVDAILNPDAGPADAGRDMESYGARIRADLRTPVTSVIGYAEMLLEAGHTEMAADLERIRSAAKRLLELSNDIVRIATEMNAESPGASASLGDVAGMTRDALAKIRPVHGGDGEPDDRQGNLLVVDDNAFNRDLLARQLARKGYLVSTAEDGRQALDRLNSEDFDLVLLDIIMPELDGVEVLRRMQSDARLREVPVVMISSLDEIDGAIRCMEIGAADYLTKPFHPTLLDARISAVLDIRRMRELEAKHRERVEVADALTLRLALGGCPASLTARIRAGETRIREHYPETTVLWCELDRILATVPRSEPTERVNRLEGAVAAIEAVAQSHGLETVLLLGSAILVAGGAPDPVEDHAARVAAAALDLLAAFGGSTGEAAEPATPLRIGMHTGQAFGAVITAERLAFHLWGDAVDLARRLEPLASPGTILVSPSTHKSLRDRFTFKRRGVIEVDGRRQMQTYVLADHAAAPSGR